MKQKKCILIIVAIIVIAIIVIIAVNSALQEQGEEKQQNYIEDLGNGVIVNTSEKLSEVKTYNGLEFTNIEFTNSGSVTSLTADVKNITSTDIEEQVVEINVLDQAGNVLTAFKGIISDVKAGESTTINADIAANYVDAYNIEIVAPE